MSLGMKLRRRSFQKAEHLDIHPDVASGCSSFHWQLLLQKMSQHPSYAMAALCTAG